MEAKISGLLAAGVQDFLRAPVENGQGAAGRQHLLYVFDHVAVEQNPYDDRELHAQYDASYGFAFFVFFEVSVLADACAIKSFRSTNVGESLLASMSAMNLSNIFAASGDSGRFFRNCGKTSLAWTP